MVALASDFVAGDSVASSGGVVLVASLSTLLEVLVKLVASGGCWSTCRANVTGSSGLLATDSASVNCGPLLKSVLSTAGCARLCKPLVSEVGLTTAACAPRASAQSTNIVLIVMVFIVVVRLLDSITHCLSSRSTIIDTLLTCGRVGCIWLRCMCIGSTVWRRRRQRIKWSVANATQL